MLGRGYTVSVTRATTAANDLIQCTTGTDNVILISKVTVTQITKVDAIEMLRVYGSRASAAGTGNALTEEPHDPGDSAMTSAFIDNQTTGATLTGQAVGMDENWNVLAPAVWRASENGGEVVLGGNDIYVIRLGTAPAASMTVRCTVECRELG